MDTYGGYIWEYNKKLMARCCLIYYLSCIWSECGDTSTVYLVYINMHAKTYGIFPDCKIMKLEYAEFVPIDFVSIVVGNCCVLRVMPRWRCCALENLITPDVSMHRSIWLCSYFGASMRCALEEAFKELRINDVHIEMAHST